MQARPRIPLRELNGHPLNQHTVWEAALPDYALDGLAVDPKPLNTLAHLGGIATVTFRSGGVPEEDEPPVGNVQGDGTLTATSALEWLRRKRPEPVELSPVWDENGEELPFFNDAVVHLDVERLSQRLSDQGRLRDTAAWAAGLNPLMLSGLRRAAARHLLEDNFQRGVSMSIISMLYTPVFALGLLIMTENRLPPEAYMVGGGGIAAALFMGASVHEARDLAYDHNLDPRNVPYTALPFGLDRLALLQATALKHRRVLYPVANLALTGREGLQATTMHGES